MTQLSIVLPVHGVQDYLRQCLDSMLDQAFTDFEVVAVDDCSPDRSGEILAEYAARDPRVRVVTSARNIGLGRARNLGLDHARGEFVWFVDSDDWLDTGALAAAVARLRITGADLLIVGWDRVHGDARVEPGTARDLLARAPTAFTIEEWPPALTVLHVAWNRVVRRDLLLRLGFAFEAGWYEDVSFSYPLLLAAPRISTLPRTCVHYRQRHTGAITRTVGDRHFEVFTHWEHALALGAEYAEPGDEVRGLLFRRMIWHFLTVLRHDARVPPGSRRRFFARMTEMYQRHLPPAGYPQPTGAQGLRHRLVARGWYRTFRVADFTVRHIRETQRQVRRFRDAHREDDAPVYPARRQGRRCPTYQAFIGHVQFWRARPVFNGLRPGLAGLSATVRRLVRSARRATPSEHPRG